LGNVEEKVKDVTRHGADKEEAPKSPEKKKKF
jgi:hypothetical protein